MPRKLKVVNIESKQVDNDDIDNNNSNNNETMEIKQEEIKQEEIKPEEIKQEITEPIKEITDIEDIPKQKVKVSNLVACNKCGRYMKENTLKFHHEKVCKVTKEQYVPKALKNTQLKAENIKHIVKEAMNLIEREKPKKVEKIENTEPIEKPIPTRTTSQPPIRKLETIQERIPTYADLRKEKMDKKLNTINSLRLF